MDNLNVGFKNSLGIGHTSWPGIGKHLGSIVSKAMEEKGISLDDLTNQFIRLGHDRMTPEFVSDYLSGNASFGVFFLEIREYLGITPEMIFRDGNEESFKGLEAYLTSSGNLDSVVCYLQIPPGEQLRQHVWNLIREKRQEHLDQPYKTVKLWAGEAKTNTEREALELLDELAGMASAPQDGFYLMQTPEPKMREAAKKLMDLAQEKANGMGYGREIIPNSRLKVFSAFLRGQRGYTIDFLCPEEYFDGQMAECMELSLEQWKAFYTSGDFSSITDDETFNNISNALLLSVDKYTPTRQPNDAERYEIHQRWAISGGAYMPGTFMGHKPPTKDEMVEIAYHMNSTFAISMPLLDNLHLLVKNRKQLGQTLELPSPERKDSAE